MDTQVLEPIQIISSLQEYKNAMQSAEDARKWKVIEQIKKQAFDSVFAGEERTVWVMPSNGKAYVRRKMLVSKIYPDSQFFYSAFDTKEDYQERHWEYDYYRFYVLMPIPETGELAVIAYGPNLYLGDNVFADIWAAISNYMGRELAIKLGLTEKAQDFQQKMNIAKSESEARWAKDKAEQKERERQREIERINKRHEALKAFVFDNGSIDGDEILEIARDEMELDIPLRTQGVFKYMIGIRKKQDSDRFTYMTKAARSKSGKSYYPETDLASSYVHKVYDYLVSTYANQDAQPVPELETQPTHTKSMNTQDTQAEVLAPETEVAISEAPQPAPAATQVATVPKTVSRITLIRVLSQLQKVVKAASPLLPIYENVFATKADDGNWVLSTYNMELNLLVRTTIAIPINVSGSRPELADGVLCIPAGILLDTAKLSSGDVLLEFNTDSIALKVTFGDCVSYKIACEWEPKIDVPFPDQSLIADADDFEVDFSVVKRAIPYAGKDKLRPGMCQVYLSWNGLGYSGSAASNGSVMFRHGILDDNCVYVASKCMNLLPDGVHKTCIVDAGSWHYLMVTFDCFQFFVIVRTDRYENYNTYTSLKNYAISHAEQAVLVLDVKHIRQIKPLAFYGNDVTKTFDMLVSDDDTTCTAVNEDFGTECEVSLYDVLESTGRTMVRVNHDQFTTALKTCLIDDDQVRVSFGMSEQPIKFEAGDTEIIVMPHKLPQVQTVADTDDFETAEVVEATEISTETE